MAVIEVRKRWVWRCVDTKSFCRWRSPSGRVQDAMAFGRWHNDMEKGHKGNVFEVLDYDLKLDHDKYVADLAASMSSFLAIKNR
jgi:hypothetical protein